MTNKRHEEFERKNEKWRKASAKAIDIRYALDDILSSFTEEEKQTKRYAQFVETVSQQFDHLLGDVNKKRIEEEQAKVKKEQAVVEHIKKKNGWLSYKSAIIAAVGAIVVQIVQILPQLITTISSLFGGTP